MNPKAPSKDDLGRLPAPARAWLHALLERVENLSGQVRDLAAQLDASRSQAADLRLRFGRSLKQLDRMQQELDSVRCRLYVDEGLIEALERHRATPEYEAVYRRPAPLVSVCIATYNRSTLLTERCLPSVLGQDYDNLEVVVVGDGCTDDTAERVGRIRDPRLRFVNQERPAYPEDPYLRWLVAGAQAGNRAMELATGDLICHLDDDDEYSKDRIRKLVALLQETRAELVWHPFRSETQKGEWETRTAEEFRIGQVTTGSVLYLSWFKRLPWDVMTHRLREPGDWNLFRRLRHIGARMRRHPDVLLTHYRQHSQDAAPPASPAGPAPARSDLTRPGEKPRL